ncbi:Acyl CoA binding protein family [Talaromyces stipitatus ATCC 10500]|uniref:Acyl CoA binding protein family n=1 Tax=Talaromyces stipitatus (strain ATCC 10500 / CBS 375.48 / QM 6759 / NRRL 1006) TaxID=441959 RepID=B8M8U6_TALSN|nr:Acyl CoA binding protein family [Talaromyces stipitatus ATCC 10500]EED20609.1 Acyl CoA binding protein family [Talaromyces stipitatus ATCC 10500]
MSTEADFKKAAEEVNKLERSPNKDEMLKLYGLYKQGTGADFSAAPKPKPGWVKSLDKDTLKYEAWEQVKDLSVEDAQKQYIEFVAELKEKYGFNA